VTRVARWLTELPGALRWAILAAGGILVAVAVGSGVWTWLERREAAAQRALGAALAGAHQAVVSGSATELEASAASLRKFLDEHPRSRVAAQGWYVLGDVEFRRRQWDAAVAAFAEAAGRDAHSLGVLSRLGEGYALEAKGEPTRALQAYERALTGRAPSDFLYGELLLAKARAHEQAKDSAAAIATYQRYLKDLPSAERTDEVRIRLALLGSAGS
jgi:tetratricopeptide (TPR) repeat protein